MTVQSRKTLRSFVLATFFWVFASPISASEKVTFNMSWLPQGSQSGFLVANAKGFYSDVGLEVTIYQGYGGQRTVNEVAQGMFDFGYGDPLSVFLNRVNGGNTLYISAISNSNAGAICYLKGDRDLTLADLAGKSVGAGATSVMQNVIPIWLELNKLPRNYLKVLRVSPGVVNTSLLEGKIDLADCWEGNSLPLLVEQAAQAGKKIGVIRYRESGYDTYGGGIVASEEFLKKRPQIAGKFIEASFKGFDAAFAAPDEAADLILKQYPTLQKSILIAQIKEVAAIFDRKQLALDMNRGDIQPSRIQESLILFRRMFNTGENIKPSDIYRNIER
ncbi:MULTISPECIES: ABC transporter substrate-binding protein [unclassified Beijerinckia]|uniref:ABC transporter substrate-binding protein n=1 Tax=unclassified Beijerinckia TaxID=2638183 RepID=UPI0008951437|nr:MULTISPECIES: ABC transporter substrate-binding protein [unclassified Beijerinckia]MDH7798927.1 NitT/TauT family transport system substrate-binding protein [Beijerinckia sp. GAS462]SED86773.1 NitT/TauT family transport system substrate-binding protein [Beijerinckia sp. 28-YEA-48]